MCACLAFVAAPALCQADHPGLMPGVTTPEAFDQPGLVQQYQQTITPDDLAAHLYVFASDYFEGRETATRGQKLAATYLAGQYRRMGLSPKGTVADPRPMAPEAYFQSFPVYGRQLQQASLTLHAGGEPLEEITFGPTTYDGQGYLAFGSIPEAEGGIVFAGYGIADDELGYNDYTALAEAGLSHEGKWVMILRDEPLADAVTSLLPTEGQALSKWSTRATSKLRVFFQLGAPAGVLVVGDTGPRDDKPLLERAAAAADAQNDVGNLSLTPQVGGRNWAPMYVISSELANRILQPTGRTVAELQREIDTNLKPVVFEVPGMTAQSTLNFETKQYSTENVAAFIEGSDPVLKNEVIVISSHYDHIGIDPMAQGDNINNGADDDGSGTVATLEIAEAFMQAKQDGYGPRRSILFLNVAGEEKGLLGSAYYSDIEPLVPIENTVANLNIDMIGRFDPTYPDEATKENYIYIIGSNLISQELHDINARLNTLTGIDIELSERFNSKDDPNQFYRRSDHWNFGKHNIPFIFFFSGTHEDYHGLDDEPEKIAYDRMARVTRLVFATAWQVANQDARPAVSGVGFN